MKIIPEILIIGCFYAAVLTLLFRFLNQKTASTALGRIAVLIIGIGFVIGTLCKILITPISWILILYILGADLCCTAFCCSLPLAQNK